MIRARDWLREAEAELKAAFDLYRTGNWSWCCFTSQQAAEKALKAVLEAKRSRKGGHNLNVLLEEVAKFVEVPSEVKDACRRLNRYYIPTRYPNAFDSGAPADQFFKEDAKEAVRDAEKVVEFAREVVGEG